VAQLSSAKFYHAEGLLALREMLEHAPRYGLKYIFVRDSYYEPLLTFSGWNQIDSFNHGDITVWTTIGIPPATEIPSPMKPPVWQGIMWGVVPFGTSLIAICLVLLERRKARGETNYGDYGSGEAIPETPEIPLGARDSAEEDSLRRDRVSS
jgi:hypothetical protein